MDILYKYYSTTERSINHFINGTIGFSYLDCLNDPFEGYGKYYFDVADDEKEYWKSIGSDVPYLVAKRISGDWREMLNFKYRVFCATEKFDNHLMWSHYANSHTGFCVGYTKHDILCVSSELNKLSYELKMPLLNNEDPKKILYFKSTDWGYEQEWRAIYELKDSDVNHLEFECLFDEKKRDDVSKLYIPHGHVQTNNLSLLESEKYISKGCKPIVIYLGLLMKKDKRDTLIEIANKKRIEIFQMDLAFNEFKLKSIKFK